MTRKIRPIVTALVCIGLIEAGQTTKIGIQHMNLIIKVTSETQIPTYIRVKKYEKPQNLNPLKMTNSR